MASDDDDNEGEAPASHGPRECMACRGSGQVISNLGGTPAKLTCPWCAGGGVRLTDVDAQAQWLEQRAGTDAAAPEPEPEPAA